MEFVAFEAREILPYLYLGGEVSSGPVVKEYGISFILNVAEESPELNIPDVEYKKISLRDIPGEEIDKRFDEAIEFMRQAKRKHETDSTNGKILVHCLMGVSRSATLVLAFLLTEYKFTLREAIMHVKHKRPQVRPNYGFFKALRKLEHSIHNKNTVDENEYYSFNRQNNSWSWQKWF